MTAEMLFFTGFALGALPGPLIILANMWRAFSDGRTVERIALEEQRLEDPIFKIISGEVSTRAAFAGDPAAALLCEGDGLRLREAKLAMIRARPRITRRIRLGMGVFLVGAPLGAFAGYGLAVWRGLAPPPTWL